MIQRVLVAALGALHLMLTAATVHASNADGPGAKASSEASAEDPLVPYWEQDVWTDPNRGFHWYAPERQAAKKGKKAVETPRRPKRLEEISDLDELRNEVERLRAVAVMDPTKESVLNYLRANAFVLQKSSNFADVARRVIWTNPDVDYNAKHSLATYAATSERNRKSEQMRQTAVRIGETHGLVFFFSSDCGYCHDMAPVLKNVADNYGITVLPVSMDGGRLQEFPNARPDNGISLLVSRGEGVSVVPSLYLVSKDKREITLLGAGALAGSEIVERIHVLTKEDSRSSR